MELNDLKAGWQNAGGNLKNEVDLQKMTRITHHPVLKKIRTKLIVESIGLCLFLFVYYDWFVGDKKPFSANLLLISSLLLYISNNMIGYFAIAKPVRAVNLKLSVQKYMARIKQLSVASLLISLTYSISLLVFFTSVISFTKEKKWILAGVIICLFQLLFFSCRNWNRQIKNLKEQTKDFDLDL